MFTKLVTICIELIEALKQAVDGKQIKLKLPKKQH